MSVCCNQNDQRITVFLIYRNDIAILIPVTLIVHDVDCHIPHGERSVGGILFRIKVHNHLSSRLMRSRNQSIKYILIIPQLRIPVTGIIRIIRICMSCIQVFIFIFLNIKTFCRETAQNLISASYMITVRVCGNIKIKFLDAELFQIINHLFLIADPLRHARTQRIIRAIGIIPVFP